MRTAKDLTRDELERVVTTAQDIFWLDEENEVEFWNPDKQWDQETVELLADLLVLLGLCPEAE